MTLETAQQMKKRLDIVANAGESKVEVQIVGTGHGYNVEVVPSDNRILCVNYYIMAAGADQLATSVFVKDGKPRLLILGLN